jgi:molybdopterin synthase catalytic subunit
MDLSMAQADTCVSDGDLKGTRSLLKTHIVEKAIDPATIVKEIEDSSAGAVVLFLGTVRRSGEAGSVSGISYEAYRSMSDRRIENVIERAKKRWPVKKVKVVHRVGELRLGEVSVAVAVSAEHRKEAFQACRYIIDNVKSKVPIWKKERLVGGRERWVEGKRLRKI